MPKFSISQSERDVMRLAGLGSHARYEGKSDKQLADVLGFRDSIETYEEAVHAMTERVERLVLRSPGADFVKNMEKACRVSARWFTFPSFKLPASGRLTDLPPEDYLPRLRASVQRPVVASEPSAGKTAAPSIRKKGQPPDDPWRGQVRFVMDRTAAVFRMVGNGNSVVLPKDIADFFLLLKAAGVVKRDAWIPPKRRRQVLPESIVKQDARLTPKKRRRRVLAESLVRKLKRWGWGSLVVPVPGDGYAVTPRMVFPEHDAMSRRHWPLREDDGAHKA